MSTSQRHQDQHLCRLCVGDWLCRRCSRLAGWSPSSDDNATIDYNLHVEDRHVTVRLLIIVITLFFTHLTHVLASILVSVQEVVDGSSGIEDDIISVSDVILEDTSQ